MGTVPIKCQHVVDYQKLQPLTGKTVQQHCYRHRSCALAGWAAHLRRRGALPPLRGRARRERERGQNRLEERRALRRRGRPKLVPDRGPPAEQLCALLLGSVRVLRSACGRPSNSTCGSYKGLFNPKRAPSKECALTGGPERALELGLSRFVGFFRVSGLRTVPAGLAWGSQCAPGLAQQRGRLQSRAAAGAGPAAGRPAASTASRAATPAPCPTTAARAATGVRTPGVCHNLGLPNLNPGRTLKKDYEGSS